MAQTSRGIKYPSDYSKVADVPSDMEEMAESIDDALDTLDNQKVDKVTGKGLSKNDFSDYYKQQVDTNTENINTNTDNIEELILENQRLKEDLKGLPQGEAEGTEIDIEDSAEMRFNSFDIEGNSEQETRSGKNKLSIPSSLARTQNGLTFVVNDNGSVTITGTSTAATDFRVEIPEKPAGTYTFSLKTIGTVPDNSQQWVLRHNNVNLNLNPTVKNNETTAVSNTVSETINTLQIFTNSGRTFNCTVYPQLEEGSTATPYEQYGASPSPDYPSEVKSCGDNINIFDITKYDYRSNAGADSQINNKTDFRITALMNNNDNCAVRFKILDLTNYAGKTLSVKAFVKSSTDTNNAFMVLRQNNSDYSGTHTNIFYDESQRTTDGVITLNYKVASTINDSNRYLFIHFYATRGTVCNIGDYVDYKVKLVPNTDAGEYSEYGQGCITEIICDENIFNKDTISENTALDSTTGTTVANNYRITSDYIRVKENTNYKFSNASDISTNGKALCFYDSNKKYISGNELSGLPNGVFTTPTNTKYIRFGYVNSGYYANLMLKEDSTSSTFIEHQSQSYTIPTQQPMREIGDTRDKFILKENGKWYEEHLIYRYIFTGNETFTKHSVTSNNSFYGTMPIGERVPKKPASNNDVAEAISNYFSVNAVNTLVFNDKVGIGITVNSGLTLYICTGLSGISTVSDLKAWLKEKYDEGNPTYVDVILTEPDEIECTSQQTEILNQMYIKAKSYKGVTHIYSNDAVSPNIKVNYKKDIDIMINNLQAQILS